MTGSGSSCTLLVVDSCSETQARIVEHVQGRGFSIITATDPSAAMAMIDLTAPDVVITDLFLPEGDGLTLTKNLQARREHCPVIVMTEDGSESSIIQALRAGAVDYLHKPIGVEELAHALQRARHMLPVELTDNPGVLRWEYILTTDSHPDHIPQTVSWLMKSTGTTLPENQRLHLRGALQELLFNAVEHGNLEIYYQEKRQALAEHRYDELVRQRLALPGFKKRLVTIHVVYEKGEKSLRYRIADEGTGFKWRSILHRANETCPLEDANGRGIFLVHSFFPDMTYNDSGNEVTITVPLS